MRVVVAPEEYDGSGLSLFLAGGITGCPNWQEYMISALHRVVAIWDAVLNPRRDNFPINDPEAAHDQIAWEFRHLRKATAISFWFPKETICPIVLFELGAWSMTGKPILVGADPAYQRLVDVVEQLRLARPGLDVVQSVGALANSAMQLSWCSPMNTLRVSSSE